MQFLSSLSIGARLVAAVVVVVGGALWIAAQDMIATEETLMDEKRTATRHLVEAVHGIVAHHAGLADSGKLSPDEAKARALGTIRGLRYEEKEYFWINDMHPRMVMHPIRPELDGQDLSGNKDPSGKPLFVEFVDTVKRSRAGFVDYQWPKPGQSAPVAKISYVKGFEPWGWVIGSGIYVDDVHSAAWARTRSQWQVIGAMIVLLAVGGWLLRRSIVRPLAKSVELARSVAQGKLDNEVRADGPKESAQLLAALNDMQNTLRERIEAERTRMNENERIRQALDASSVPVRIVDNDGRILFLNRSLRRTVESLEPEIRKRIPAFDKDKLMGGSIGIFYPDPQQALERLRTLTAERRSALDIGGRHFDIVTNPIVNEAGERLGTVGEWVDRHDELMAEKRLSDLIARAGRGDFSGRVDLTGLSGFHLTAAQGINQLMDQVSQSLSELVELLDGLSRGVLDDRMEGDFQGVFAKLQSDMNSSLSKLSTTMSEIRTAAESVSVAAREIAQGNSDLSTRTEQQASNLEEIASSLEDFTGTVKHTTENTLLANTLAGEASKLAEQGGTTVTRVVATMNEIGESSRRITEIIGVINGIAFQTNILALNAAVEAARAGEHGRGFAVVATEVRTLAQRSADAAQEIRALISNATERVDAGARLVEEAGGQMNNIVDAVKRVTDIISDIASAASRQTVGIDQLNAAVQQMDKMTQQNAALVEQAAAAGESLEEQSVNLASAISTFRLGDESGPVRIATRRAA